MRALFLATTLAAIGCGDNLPGPPWLVEAHLLIDGYHETNTDCRTGLCVHDENTDLTIFDGATYLVHRTAESQTLGPNSSLRVSRSDDHGATWTLLAIIPAPDTRDLRDPCFYVMPDGELALKAITRVPSEEPRDGATDSISVNTISSDGGTTWSPLTAIGPEMWSFWRIRQDSDGTYYSAAYQDGDLQVQLFSSTDGQNWTAGATVYNVSVDTPLETELIFGADGVTALVRMDGTDQELLGNVGRLRTKVCTSPRPYTSFDCSGEYDGARLDGPVAFAYNGREFVIARKHFIEAADRKRTALYELVGNNYVEDGEFPSAGDTSYAGVAPIDDNRFLVTYYSSNIIEDPPWIRAMSGPTDIWQATIDLATL